MSHACQRFWNCYKTLTFCSLLGRCRIPCACYTKRHLNVQKWSEHGGAFSFFNVSNILTWKCASRHHAVPFFDVSTSKSAPRIVCCTFWLGNVLRATTACKFQYLNFQKCLKPAVFCTFWLRNVLRATTACNFSFLIWPDGSRTRRFSEPTFRPSEATNHWKNTVFRDFATFSRTCIFRLCLFLFSDLLSSSLLFSSLTLPTSAFSFVHVVGSLTSKFPSMAYVYLCARIVII